MHSDGFKGTVCIMMCLQDNVCHDVFTGQCA